MKCKLCESTRLRHDVERDEMVCLGCGVLQSERVTYNNYEKLERNMTFADRSSMSETHSREYGKKRKTRFTLVDSDRNIKVKTTVSRHGCILDLRDDEIERAIDIVKALQSKMKPKSLEIMSLASIYHVVRDRMSCKDVCDISDEVVPKNLVRLVKKIRTALELPHATLDPSIAVVRSLKVFGFDGRRQMRTIHTVKIIQEKCPNLHPITIMSSAVVIVKRCYSKTKLSITETKEVADHFSSTLNTTLRTVESLESIAPYLFDKREKLSSKIKT